MAVYTWKIYKCDDFMVQQLHFLWILKMIINKEGLLGPRWTV